MDSQNYNADCATDIVSVTTRAFSYVRFSRPEQIKGDSLRRQLALSAEYAAEQGFDLDDSLHDLGVSGASGLNRTRGALGQFYRRVEAGGIPSGSHLLVESLDRLSREEILDALAPFLELIRAGITIHTLSDRQVYSRETLRNPMMLFGSLMVMSRAYEESATKSQRVLKAKAQRISEAAETGKIVTTSCPAWLKVVEREGQRQFRKIPDHVTVIQQIFRWNCEGFGFEKIVKLLNQKRVPTFSQSNGWHSFYVRKILCERAVLGEFRSFNRNLSTKGKAKPRSIIPNYYPAVIDEALWERAAAARDGRKGTGGRKDRGYTNLLAGLLYCAECGSKMRTSSKIIPAGKEHPREVRHILVCDGNNRGLGCGNTVTYDYLSLESVVLERVGSLIVDPATDRQDAEMRVIDDQITLLSAENEQRRKRRADLLLRQNDPDLSDAILDAVRLLEIERKQIERKIADLNKRLTVLRGTDAMEAHQAAIQAVQKAALAGDVSARARLAEGMRAIVDFGLCTRERRSVLISLGAMIAAHEFVDGEEVTQFFARRGSNEVPRDWIPWLAKVPLGDNEALRKRRETALLRQSAQLPKPKPEPPPPGDKWVDRTTPTGFPLGGDGRVAQFEMPTGKELDDWRRRAEAPVVWDYRNPKHANKPIR